MASIYCKSCGELFVVLASIADEVQCCPFCKSEDVERKFLGRQRSEGF